MDQGFLKKWLILRQGQKMHKMNMEHLTVQESKEESKNKKNKKTNRGMSKRHWNQLKELSIAKAGTI